MNKKKIIYSSFLKLKEFILRIRNNNNNNITFKDSIFSIATASFIIYFKEK